MTLVKFRWEKAEMCRLAGRYSADVMLYYKMIFCNQKYCSEKEVAFHEGFRNQNDRIHGRRG